jgi:hypothetical protein
MALAITYIGSNVQTANLSSYSFGNFTTPVNGVIVVIAYGGTSSNRTISAIRVDGSGTIAVNSPSALTTCGIGYREMVAGTYPVTAAWSGTQQHAAVAVYLVTGYSTPAPDYTAQQTATGAIGLNFLNTGSVSGIYGVMVSSTGVPVSDSITYDYSSVMETRRGVAGKKLLISSGHSEGFTLSGINLVGSAIAWAEPSSVSHTQRQSAQTIIRGAF